MAEWLERLIAQPPRSLSTLEAYVGKLDVDFADVEGMGSVYRTYLEPRGAVRAEVLELDARFQYFGHHEDPTVPRDMTVEGFDLWLDVPHALLAQLLEAAHGRGTTFAIDRVRYVEYGKWWYLREPRDTDVDRLLRYAVRRPEWAIPRAPAGALENLLATLHDRLICDDELPAIAAALSPLAVAGGAELGATSTRVELAFRPAIPLAPVLAALRWENPVASGGGMDLSLWRVYANRDVSWTAPSIKHWCIEVRLAGWPRGPDGTDLPELGRSGPSPLLDMRTSVTPVAGIAITRAERAG
jgi:hypothetical protein